ncbi:hypothetical protein [Roseibium sp.]|uniref:hypothetical protein n=1 Tax=Roseibium sp. TaxID=1936156 RepID=UPI003A980081
MAVAKQNCFRLIEGEHSIVVAAPDFFEFMLSSTLCGWAFETETSGAAVDISVEFDGTRFRTDSRIYVDPILRTDPVHALNDFFLTLAYLYTRQNTDHHLIHCSAYSENDRNILLLGDKKSGKSFAATLHGLTGNCFIADDLLLWNYKTGFFKALGLPPRIRRPVPEEIIEHVKPEAFLAGQNLAYLKKDAYKGTDAGSVLEFDQVRVFESPRICHDVKLINYAKELDKRRIDSVFWQNKKDRLS